MKRLAIGLLIFVLLAAASTWVTLSEGESKGREAGLSHPKAAGDAGRRGNVTGSFNSTDGKILEKKRLQVNSRYADQTDLFRIVYMSEGVRVVGYLCKPKHVTGKLPVLIYNRGGIVDTARIGAKSLSYFTKLAANQYIVLASQYRGTAGSGGTRAIAGDDVQDVLNLLTLADRLPYVDRNRKVMLGFSRGGMMTYLAIKEGADIRAAAVVGGVTNLSRLYEQSGELFRNPLSRLVGDPLLDAKAYHVRSAIHWADRLRVPILLLHGLEDHTVPPEHSERLAERLVDLGYEHRLVRVPGGNHYLSNKSGVRDREILGWFNHYLQ